MLECTVLQVCLNSLSPVLEKSLVVSFQKSSLMEYCTSNPSAPLTVLEVTTNAFLPVFLVTLGVKVGVHGFPTTTLISRLAASQLSVAAALTVIVHSPTPW